MLRKILLSAALIAASTGAFARGGDHWGIEPQVSVSVGSLWHDGFNINFATGGGHYYSPRHYSPAPVIVVPPPQRIVHVHRHEYRNKHWDDRGRRAWKEHDRWDHRRDDRRGWDDHRGRNDDRGRGGHRGGDRSRWDR